MYNQVYYIIFPGLQYKADGPVWVDKIEISASINNKPTKICDISNQPSPPSVATIRKIESLDKVIITDFATFLHDNTLYIQNKHSKGLATFENESYAGSGLAAVEFIGGTTDIIIFTVKLYTNYDWVSQDNTATLNHEDPKYKLLDTIEIKYNPFISLTSPPSLKTYELKRPWSDLQFKPTPPQISQSTINITDRDSKYIYLDSNVDLLSKSYDNLPMVPIVSTDPAWKASQGEVLGDGMLDDIQKKLNCDSFHLLLFGAYLPGSFGCGDRDYDKLAICAYRTSVSGSVGRQRYTLVGVYKEKLDVDVKWQQSVEYDLSDYIQQVKYYSSDQFSIGIDASFQKTTVDIDVPNELYTESKTTNTFSLQSGCSWKPVISADKLGFSPLWDVWSSYSSLEPYVWTTTSAGNRGTSIPTSVEDPHTEPKMAGTTSTQVASTAKDTVLKGSLDFDVYLSTLENVRYLTFYETSYQTQNFSSVLNGSASTQICHKVEGGKINVKHASTKITPDISIKITADIKSVPKTSNYSIYPYVEFSYTEGGETQSYPIGESSAGSMGVTGINKILNKIECYDSNDHQMSPHFYKAVSEENCCWECNEDDVCYILEPNEYIKISFDCGKTGVVKYLMLPTNPSELQMEQMGIEDSFVNIGEDSTVTIKNTRDYPVVVGSLGYLAGNISIDDIMSKDNPIAAVHSVGSYEDVKIFDRNIQWFYFPPADTFCVGFYKITQDQTVSKDSVIMLYDTVMKNETILNQLVGFQYKISSI